MSFSPFSVESLEQRRLLSGGGNPLGSARVFVPSFGGGGVGPPVTRQGPVNGGFEQSPDLTGWQTAGNDFLQAADFHTPAEGTLQAVVSNAQQPNNGTLPVGASALESFLGLSSGGLSSPTKTAVNGSAIKQDITGKARDAVTFKADFLTNENPAKPGDYAFVTVTLNGQTQLFKLNAVLKPVTVLNNANFASETGYKTYAIILPKNGTYTIGYGVVNVGDSTVASDLLVDNVQLQPGPFKVHEHEHEDEDEDEDDDDQGDEHDHGGNGLGDDDDDVLHDGDN
jgi:hypothetical protein